MSAARIVSYRLVLPPPWRRLGLGESLEDDARALVEAAAARAPDAIPPDQLGPRVREAVRAVVARAEDVRARGGIDLYLPADLLHGFVVRASLAVSQTRPPTPSGVRVAAQDVVDRLLAAPGATPLETPGDAAAGLQGTTWVRRAGLVERPGEDPARTLSYTAALPDGSERWMVVTSTVLGTDAADPDGSAVRLDALFDAVMTTWRWEIVQVTAGTSAGTVQP